MSLFLLLLSFPLQSCLRSRYDPIVEASQAGTNTGVKADALAIVGLESVSAIGFAMSVDEA